MIIAAGPHMAMVLARPPKPRCRAAAFWEGVTAPMVALIQACTSRASSRKGNLPAGSRWGPVVRA
eukprot:4756618-Pyramimonas_sp.AAC.1